jgi:hypothetical protein
MPVSDTGETIIVAALPDLSGADMRSYEALFAHPSSHNLKWRDVVHLFEILGSVTETPNHEYVLVVGEGQHVMRRPHSKDLTAAEIMALRHFVSANVKVPRRGDAVADDVTGLDMLVVIEHHEARIFVVELAGDDPDKHVIRPYDPHHFLHHLTHKDQSRERGQRAHEDATFYERIAQAVVAAARIVVIGRGTGKSDAADHLVAYFRDHHTEISNKVLCALTTDLSHITEPQLLAMGRDAFGGKG